MLQVMITAGGNQAFAMVALALLDPGDRVLLVRPISPKYPCAVFSPYIVAVAYDQGSHISPVGSVRNTWGDAVADPTCARGWGRRRLLCTPVFLYAKVYS